MEKGFAELKISLPTLNSHKYLTNKMGTIRSKDYTIFTRSGLPYHHNKPRNTLA